MTATGGEIVAVTRVLTHPGLRAKLASEFLERQWSSREMTRRWLGLYDELVRTKRDDSTTTRYDSAA